MTKKRTASNLAFVGQLLLHSVSIAQHEIINARGTDAWRELVDIVLNSSQPEGFSPGSPENS